MNIALVLGVFFTSVTNRALFSGLSAEGGPGLMMWNHYGTYKFRCGEHGITHERTVPYNSHQNAEERFNLTFIHVPFFQFIGTVINLFLFICSQ